MDNTRYQKYYKWIIDNFGHIYLSAPKYLAQCIAMYNPEEVINLIALYRRVAAATGESQSSIPKQIQLYIRRILKDYTVEDLEELFGYKFQSDGKSVWLKELIPVMRRYLDSLPTDEEE